MSTNPMQQPCRIIALHGFWGAPSDFDALRSSLKNNVLWTWEILHLPGHGGEPLPAGGASLESLADWCAGKLDALGGDEHCVLVGYSLGARIALATAIRHPNKMVGLALLSGSPGLENPVDRTKRAEEDTKRAKKLASCKTREELEKFLRQWWKQPVFESPAWRSELYEPHIAKRLDEDSSQLAVILEQASPGRQEPLWHRLTEINIPVICIAGMADLKFSDYALRMNDQLNWSRAVFLPGAGHSLLLENPPTLASSMLSWLAMFESTVDFGFSNADSQSPPQNPFLEPPHREQG